MKLNKKIILGTTTILTIVTPLATVVSCGDKTTLDKTTIYLNKINTAITDKQNSIIIPTIKDKKTNYKRNINKIRNCSRFEFWYFFWKYTNVN